MTEVAQLTPDAPLAAKGVVDVLDDWADDETRDVARRVQHADFHRGGVAQVLVPQRRGLQTADKGAVILSSDRAGHLGEPTHIRSKPSQP